MELHSYAKRRTVKKWTLEQKRKLVEARIRHDAIFINEPRNSVLPWKKILTLAKLDDYNVFFVRKQWSVMVAKYKQYKQNRLGNIPFKAIDGEMIQKITHEWEFFQPIHHYMTRKTTNLHSYALIRRSSEQQDTTKDAYKQQRQQQQQLHNVNVFSSDTNDDFITALARPAEGAEAGEKGEYQQVETDQEFYWQHAIDGGSMDGGDSGGDGCAIVCGAGGGGNPALSYFADASEDTQESMVIESATTQLLLRVKSEEMDANEGNELIDGSIVAVDDAVGGQQHQLPAHSDDTPTTTPSSSLSAGNQAEFQPAQQQLRDLKTKADSSAAGNVANGNQAHKRITATGAATADVQTAPPPPPAPPLPQQPRQVTQLTERAKYYRHKRRFNRRVERRFDAILNVFGQIVRAEYPSIDVSPLLGAATATGAIINKLFSSGEEDEEEDDDDDVVDDDVINAHANETDIAVNAKVDTAGTLRRPVAAKAVAAAAAAAAVVNDSSCAEALSLAAAGSAGGAGSDGTAGGVQLTPTRPPQNCH